MGRTVFPYVRSRRSLAVVCASDLAVLQSLHELIWGEEKLLKVLVQSLRVVQRARIADAAPDQGQSHHGLWRRVYVSHRRCEGCMLHINEAYLVVVLRATS